MDLKPFSQPRFIADQTPEFRPQRIRQRAGKRRQQYPRIRIGPRQEDRSMQRNDGLARTCRSGHPRRTAVVAIHQGALRRVQENCPLVPGIVERALQFPDVGHHAKAALCVGMCERIGPNRDRLHGLWRYARGQIEQRLGRLAGEVVRQFQQSVLGGAADIGQPFRRYTIPKELVIRQAGEQRRLRRRPPGDRHPRRLDVSGDDDLLYRLPNFDELRRAGFRMRFELPPLPPLVGAVVVTDIAKQQAGLSPVNDQPDVCIYPDRPEPPIFGLVQLVELQTRMRRIQLKIEGRSLYGLLLLTRQSGEAAGERVCDAKFHCGGILRDGSLTLSVSFRKRQPAFSCCRTSLSNSSANDSASSSRTNSGLPGIFPRMFRALRNVPWSRLSSGSPRSRWILNCSALSFKLVALPTHLFAFSRMEPPSSKSKETGSYRCQMLFFHALWNSYS